MTKCVSQDFLFYGNKLRSAGYSVNTVCKKKREGKKAASRHDVCKIQGGYISKEKQSSQSTESIPDSAGQ